MVGMPSLELRVHGLRSVAGNLVAVVWDHVDRFRSSDEGHAFRVLRRPVEGEQQVLRLEGLPEGHYGYVVIHDENGDGHLDFSFDGPPEEGVGFSRNPKGEPAGAEWRDCSFEIGDYDVAHEVQMRYWGEPQV